MAARQSKRARSSQVGACRLAREQPGGKGARRSIRGQQCVKGALCPERKQGVRAGVTMAGRWLRQVDVIGGVCPRMTGGHHRPPIHTQERAQQWDSTDRTPSSREADCTERLREPQL